MRILAAAFVAMLSSTVAMAQEPIKLTDGDRQLVVKEVIEYFKNNPQELVEAIVEWRKNQAPKEPTQTAPPSEKLPDPVTGRVDAPVSIMEFSDYGCSECNAVSSVLKEVAALDPDVRIIHRDSPRSSKDASAASIDMIAVASKGGDWAAMREIYLQQGVQPEYRIKALSLSGVEITNEDRRKAAKTMEVNANLADRTGAEKLPAIIIVVGQKVQALAGMQTKQSVLEAIANVSRAAAEQMKK
jgi:Protein-disulfide isomerase